MGTIECNIGDIPSNYKEINCSKDTSDTSDSIRAFMCKPGFKRKEGDNTIIINNVPTAESCKFTTSPSLKCEPIPYKLPNIIRPDKTEHFQCSVTDLSSSTKENINADKECFDLIAKKADGALRDALSIFDKVTSVTFVPGAEAVETYASNTSLVVVGVV